MTTPILATKLYIPLPRPNLVPRWRLIEQLNAVLTSKLTLVSAPAGFGKSTLLASWVAQVDTAHVGWLSLDEADNNLSRFLTYFVAALQSIETDMGQQAMVELQSPGEINLENMLTCLINEIVAFPAEIVLVLDDYHVIETPQIDQAITFLLDHLPSQIHIVIASRIDPTLPLSRLRARGQMIELRVEDLRFTADEAAKLLNQTMGLNLTSQDVEALEGRTEGWIAGLHLAALSMQGLKHQDDISDFVNRFAGSDRYIQDYLTDEVLQQQPKLIKEFLLQTSILSRLNASLCASLTKMENAQETLEDLEIANLFIIPLDNERGWYRYHHLFADLLQQRLRQSFPELIPELHIRASQWYEQHGLLEEAIQHAFAANDLERVASLAEVIEPTIDGNLQWTQWLGWVKKLPVELIRSRPVLCTEYGTTLLMVGELESAEVYLNDAERLLDNMTNPNVLSKDSTTEIVIIDEAQFQSLPATIAIARAYIAQALGDIASTVQYAQKALAHSRDRDDLLNHGRATTLLGLASWANGDLETAAQAFADFISMMRRTGNESETIGAIFVLATIKIAQGCLREAFDEYQQSIQFVTDRSGEPPIGTEDLYRGISEIYCEWGDLAAAERYLKISKNLGDQTFQSDWQNRWCVTRACLLVDKGDLDSALEQLEEAEQLSIQNPLPEVRPAGVMKARIWVRQGKIAETLNWVHEKDLSIDDELHYMKEFEHITLARLLIAQYQKNREDKAIRDAEVFLEGLLQAAEEGKRTTSVIEILILLALTYETQGNRTSALKHLEQALKLAEPEGFVRIFVAEGQPMIELLSAAAVQGIVPSYSRKLLTLIQPHQQQGLVEPLTEREIEVLQLIAQGLSNREIGEQLYLALDTVKGYNRKIFGKLGVRKRLEAVNRAQGLGIL